MSTAALGLKSIFRAISSRNILQQLFERFAPSAAMDWSINKRELPDALYRTCADLRVKAKHEHDNIVCALHEICDICADPMTGERLARELHSHGMSDQYRKECRGESRPLQNGIGWVLLHAPTIWEHLLVSAKAVQIHARTLEEYDTVPIRAPDQKRIGKLREAIAAYLVKETLHGEYVHIEPDVDANTFRYLVSVNSFPINVQQFDIKGEYSVARDSNALNFMYEYLPQTGVLRIKCPLDVQKRRDLMRLFAEIILDAEVKGKPRKEYDLSQHLEGRIMPITHDARIESVRRSGLAVQFRNRSGTFDTISVTTQGPTDLNKRMLDFLEISKVPREKATVVAVDYDLKLHGTNGRIKTIHTRLTPAGFQFKCRDAREREIIRNYLNEIVS